MWVKVLPQPVGPLKSWLFAGHFLDDLGECFRPYILPVNSRECFFLAVLQFCKRLNQFKNQHLHLLVAQIYSHRCGWRSGLWFELKRSHHHIGMPTLMWSLPVFPPRCLGYIPERGNNTYTCRWNGKFGTHPDTNNFLKKSPTFQAAGWISMGQRGERWKPQLFKSLYIKLFLQKQNKKGILTDTSLGFLFGVWP